MNNQLPQETIKRIEDDAMKLFPLEIERGLYGSLNDSNAGYRQIWINGATTEAKKSQILLEALQKAVAVIKQWHQADDVWEIYYNHAPEMKPIREALTSHNNSIK